MPVATHNPAFLVTTHLPYRPPYNHTAMLAFCRKRQLDAIELIAPYADNTWVLRTFSFKNGGQTHSGWLRYTFKPEGNQVQLEVSDSLQAALPLVITRTRAALDLDADPVAIDAVLCKDGSPSLAGLRVPGGLDGFEIALRAIVGQQVSVAAGRTLVQRVADRFGQSISTPFPELTRLFPSPEVLAQAQPGDLGELGIVKQRQKAIIALAEAVASGKLDLNTPASSPAQARQAIATLTALPGIGDWTAQYIAMRALRWGDAFPAGDVALHNALKLRGEKNPAKAALAAAQHWQPWRSYGVMRAWSSLGTL